MSESESECLSLDHLCEVALFVVRGSLHDAHDPAHDRAHVSDITTSRGVIVTVNAVTREEQRVTHVVTLAAHAHLLPALDRIAALLARLLDVNAKVMAEKAHLTLMFTVGPREEAALQARLALHAAPSALRAALESLSQA